jgi:V/A-type H+-transporting ATPase subunit F
LDYFFIGASEILTAFRFAGVTGKAISTAEEAVSAFHGITEHPMSYKILILTEQAADWLGDELTEWQLSGKYPLVVEIPGLDGKIEGRKTLVDSIREAIGIHV